jgi:beta-galactosidase
MITLKEELHRDMIIRDRSHPSILDWESNNGTMEESIGTGPSVHQFAVGSDQYSRRGRPHAGQCQRLLARLHPGRLRGRCQERLTRIPNNPAWGSEYWGTGTARGLAWNYELAFVAPFLEQLAPG